MSQARTQPDQTEAARKLRGGAGVRHDWPSPDGAMDPGEDWVDGDWDLPASAFRPDPYAQPGDDEVVPEASNNPPNQEASDDVPGERPIETADARPRTASGTWRITPCPGAHQPNPLPVSIGVVVSVQSLFGYSNTPGQLMDRSSLVPADVIRELAQQQGSLFYRLLTDEKGNLLDVTEMGRFPSRRLGMAVKFRAGVCQCLTCHVSATRCDLDHLVPVPEGPTSGRQPGSGMPGRAPREDPRRAPGQPDRATHDAMDHANRPRLYERGPATSCRGMASAIRVNLGTNEHGVRREGFGRGRRSSCGGGGSGSGATRLGAGHGFR